MGWGILKTIYTIFALVLFTAALVASGQEPVLDPPQYFVTVYSYQGRLILPRNPARLSHTFARFSKVQNGRVVSAVDISWLPAPGYFAGLRHCAMPLVGSVPGRNYSLRETEAIAARCGARIQPFGPYRISPSVFQAAADQQKFLKSGFVRYAIFAEGDSPGLSNCIKAVRDVVAPKPSGLLHGAAASADTVRYFAQQGAIISPYPVPEWGEAIDSFVPPQMHLVGRGLTEHRRRPLFGGLNRHS